MAVLAPLEINDRPADGDSRGRTGTTGGRRQTGTLYLQAPGGQILAAYEPSAMNGYTEQVYFAGRLLFTVGGSLRLRPGCLENPLPSQAGATKRSVKPPTPVAGRRSAVTPTFSPLLRGFTWCFSLLLLAFLIRLHTVFGSGNEFRVLRGLETQAVADSLAKTGAFSNPFRYETGPTAHLAPVYPLFLGGLELLFPDEADYEAAKQVLSALAASLLYALLPLLAVAARLPRRVGLIGALVAIAMFLLLPANVRPLETQGSWEHAWAALGIVALSILAESTFRQARFTTGRAVAWGVAWGIYLLLIPTMALVFPAWLIQLRISDCGLRISGGNVGNPLRFAALSTACLLVTLAPWTVRNWLVLGSPVWGRDNLGLELHVSNNDCAAATFGEMQRSGCHAKTHPNANPQEAAKIREAGEIRYNQQRLWEALAWVRSHPARFTGLTLERFALFWFPEVGRGAASYPLWAVTLTGFAGLILCYKQNRLAAMLFGALLLVYPLAYYFVQHFLRYRYPVLWVSSLMTAYALTVAWQRFKAGPTTS